MMRDGRPSVFREFATGVSLLGRGLGTWRTAPGLMLLGMVPALIVGAVSASCDRRLLRLEWEVLRFGTAISTPCNAHRPGALWRASARL